MEKVGNHLCEKILVVDDTGSARAPAAEMLAHSGYATVQAATGVRALDLVASEGPDLVILDGRASEGDGMDLVRRIKQDPFTHHIPVLILTSEAAGRARPASGRPAGGGADAVLSRPLEREALVALVQLLLKQSNQYDPLTHLPAAPYLHRQINARLAQNQPTAILYADIDRFRPFQQLYGQAVADELLLAFARLLVETLPARGAFTGHLGGDDFLAVLLPETAETFAQTLVDRFATLRDSFYTPDDRARREIVVEGRDGPRVVPLMTLSVALVSNERRALINYVQVSNLLAGVMRFLKGQGGGAWARDRRPR